MRGTEEKQPNIKAGKKDEKKSRMASGAKAGSMRVEKQGRGWKLWVKGGLLQKRLKWKKRNCPDR